MEAVAAFGLACNILQVVQLGCQAALTFKQAYKIDTTGENFDIDARTRHLSRALAQLDDSLLLQHDVEDAELLQLSRQCADVAKVLNDKLAPFAPNPSRHRDRWRNGIKALRIKAEVETLSSKLLKYQQILDTKILIGLRSRIDIASLKHSKMLATLDTELQTFIQQQIVLQRDEHELTRLTVLRQSNDLSSKLDSMKLSNAEDASYQRLVTSLRFLGMNQRKNQITTTHHRTFRWIFGIDQHDDRPDAEPKDAQDEDNDMADTINANFARAAAKASDRVEGDHMRSPFLGQIYEVDDFVEWLTQRNDNYWITGKPGSGKSTLMSFIVNHNLTRQHLAHWATPQVAQVVDAYFWNSGSNLQRSFKGMLATILLQLLQQAGNTTRQTFMRLRGINQKTSLDDWSTGELELQVYTLLTSSERKLCIFFDGLDEVEVAQSESDDVVVNFVELISRLNNVKCCISSRPLQIFELAFGSCAQLRLEQLNASDIDLFFQDQMRSSTERLGVLLSGDEFGELRAQFNRKADGVFLWAHLALKSILQGLRHKDAFDYLLRRLEALPSELESLYEHMFSLSNRDSYLYQQEAASFMRIILLLLKHDFPAGLPLRPNLLQFTLCFDKQFASATTADIENGSLARACQEMRTRITTRCVGLLEVRTIYGQDRNISYKMLPLPLVLASERSKQVQLIHRTAKDFLLLSPAGRRVWEGIVLSDENLNDTFMKAVLQEQILSIKPVTRDWLWALFRDVNVRRHMWTNESLCGFVKHAEEIVASSTIQHLATDHRSWFARLVNDWETRQSYGISEQPPLDVLGFVMEGCEFGLVLDWCRHHIEHLTPEYCSYLLSCSCYPKKNQPETQLEIFALLAPRLTELRRLHSLRIYNSDGAPPTREAAWRSVLTDACPRLLDVPRTSKHDELLETLHRTAHEHGSCMAVLYINIDTGVCSYTWLPRTYVDIWKGGLYVIVKLDPLHLAGCYAAFCANSCEYTADRQLQSELKSGSSQFLFEIIGIDTNHVDWPGAQRGPTAYPSYAFCQTSTADSLLIKATLLKDSPEMYFMTHGKDPFRIPINTVQEICNLTEDVRSRSQEILYVNYVRREGLVVDATDVRALREPPAMFLNRDEDLHGAGVICRSTTDSVGVDEFYDVQTSF